jgi:hypothetical protein
VNRGAYFSAHLHDQSINIKHKAQLISPAQNSNQQFCHITHHQHTKHSSSALPRTATISPVTINQAYHQLSEHIHQAPQSNKSSTTTSLEHTRQQLQIGRRTSTRSTQEIYRRRIIIKAHGGIRAHTWIIASWKLASLPEKTLPKPRSRVLSNVRTVFPLHPFLLSIVNLDKTKPLFLFHFFKLSLSRILRASDDDGILPAKVESLDRRICPLSSIQILDRVNKQ